MKDLKEKLIEKIKAGEVAMVPKWQFVLRGVLWGLAVSIVALLAVYLLSFVMFTLRESGLIFAPSFGRSGIALLIMSSPWLLISLVFFFLAVLYLLVSKYSFSYRKPLVYSIVGVVAFVIVISALIQQTNFHRGAEDFVLRHNLPGLAPMYRDIDSRPRRDITRGIVTELSEAGIKVISEDGSEYVVELPDGVLAGADISEGDSVMVFGRAASSTIRAFGIRIDDGRLPPRMPAPMPGMMLPPQ